MLADAMARHYAAHVVAYGYTLFVAAYPTTNCTVWLSGRMLCPRTEAQDRQTVGRPAVHCQAAEFRSGCARRMHNGSCVLVETAIAEAVLVGGRASMPEGGGCTAGMWLHSG